VTEPGYANSYENLAFTRDDDGVLVLRFHTNGGPVVFTGRTHEELPAALEQVSLDSDNKALVITGTGDSFMDKIDGPSLG
jgi:enoyl-CoA hydratase/carnithine racemase